jgi:adenosylcobinamide-GDP ribazoletransferase
VKAFYLAFQFLTVISLRKIAFSNGDFTRSLFWFFAPGLFIGAIQSSIAFILIRFHIPVELAAVSIVIAGALLTGGLHLDGTADAADGFGAGYDRESILRIMKDDRLGVYGVTAIVISLYVKIFASRLVLQNQELTSFIVSPMISRSLIACTCSLLPYARDAGTGKAFSNSNFFVHSLPSLLISVALTLWIAGPSAWLPLTLTLVVSIFFCLYCYSKIHGYTGDTLGFQNELSEIVFLLTA